jgi:hypothetical protein
MYNLARDFPLYALFSPHRYRLLFPSNTKHLSQIKPQYNKIGFLKKMAQEKLDLKVYLAARKSEHRDLKEIN